MEGNGVARCDLCAALKHHHSWCTRYQEGDPIATDPKYLEEPVVKEAKPVWQKPSLAGSYDVISSPAHYARFAIQPIDFIEANGLDFLQASVLKYLVRFPFKNGVEDLHKARDMLNRLIKREEDKEPKDFDMTKHGPDGYELVPTRTLVRNAGQEIGGQPATGDPEDRRNTGDGSK